MWRRGVALVRRGVPVIYLWKLGTRTPADPALMQADADIPLVHEKLAQGLPLPRLKHRWRP